MRTVTAGETGASALVIDGVSHSFGQRKALDEATFSVGRSRFCVLLGLNGAGKTTLFSLITRLYTNTSGTVQVLGHDVRREPTAALERLGVVFQQRTLDLDLTALQNLMYHGALHGMSNARIRERAAVELERVGLTDRAGDKVRALSGGQMRRIEIARALLHGPDLLLLDEPTVGLDIEARRDILDRVRGLCRDQGVAVLWATHLLDEVPGDAQVVVLHNGRVRAEGDVDDVIAVSGATNLQGAFEALSGDGTEATS
ncbi:MAG: ATP-binding cassette domain-containing protein [Hyphomicrobiales bacterium]